MSTAAVPSTNGRAGAPETALLCVENLQTSFDTPYGRVPVVSGVSFRLDAGETLGIVGESGSGKSVLVRSVMNLLPPNAVVSDTSRVVYDGRDVRALTRGEAKHFWGPEIAMVFQDPMTSLNPVKKIGEHITESLRFHTRLGRNEARDRALELLDEVRIPSPKQRLNQYPHELSGGMRQRVTIAVALACEPKLLIADEPTTALDVTVQAQILDLLRRLQQERDMAMILVTHDLGVVAHHSDRVAVMYAGQLQEVADTADLFERVRHPYTEALLGAIPRLSRPSHTRLDVIEGRPPDLLRLGPGCRFAPRCTHASDLCRTDAPPVHDPDDHLVRCHFPLDIPSVSWPPVVEPR